MLLDPLRLLQDRPGIDWELMNRPTVSAINFRRNLFTPQSISRGLDSRVLHLVLPNPLNSILLSPVCSSAIRVVLSAADGDQTSLPGGGVQLSTQ